MSRSNKSRFGMRSKSWKDTVERSHNQTKTRKKWKKISSRSARRKGKQPEGRERHLHGNAKGQVPKDRMKGMPQEDE